MSFLVAQLSKESACNAGDCSTLGLEDPQRREWQSTPHLPEELHGQRSQASCSPSGRSMLHTKLINTQIRETKVPKFVRPKGVTKPSLSPRQEQ